MSRRSENLDHTRERLDESWLKKEFGVLLYRLKGLVGDSRARLQGAFAQALLDETLTIETPIGQLSFVLLGKAAAGRAQNLLTKQPATIEWIDSFRPNSVFWDVGANIGVYTLYAALRGDTRVVAFEPAAVNYFLLAANCEVNNLGSRVDCLLVGVGSERAIAQLQVSQFEPAQSFSFSGKQDQQHRGRQAALVLSMDQLVEEYGLPCPNYIKIDVPGFTEAALAGGTRMLQRPDVRELHVELREHSKSGQRIVEMLERHGFVAASGGAHGGSSDLTFARLRNAMADPP